MKNVFLRFLFIYAVEIEKKSKIGEIIKSKLGTGEITTTPHDPFYPSRDTLNSDKAKTMLNFNPSVDIEEGIPKYINWFLGQPFYFENLDINKQFPLGMKI